MVRVVPVVLTELEIEVEVLVKVVTGLLSPEADMISVMYNWATHGRGF